MKTLTIVSRRESALFNKSNPYLGAAGAFTIVATIATPTGRVSKRLFWLKFKEAVGVAEAKYKITAWINHTVLPQLSKGQSILELVQATSSYNGFPDLLGETITLGRPRVFRVTPCSFNPVHGKQWPMPRAAYYVEAPSIIEVIRMTSQDLKLQRSAAANIFDENMGEYILEFPNATGTDKRTVSYNAKKC